MKFTFLGTAAANAFPEAFCACANCQSARHLGGPSLRKRSAALINDDLLIDLGPDIMAASQVHAVSLVNVQYCLQTHPHADHLDLSHFESRSPGFGVIGAPVLNFYASRETLAKAAQTFERDIAGYNLLAPEAEQNLNLKIHPVEPFVPFMAGPYRATAFPANHAPGLGAMLYAVEANGRSIFYGTDTDALPEAAWQALSRLKLRFDLVILDHTYGQNKQANDHMSAGQVIEHFARMRVEGLLAPNARSFATHIAHDANPAHPELVGLARQQGYEIAFDGLTLEL
jgi:phosphoribosyl 1,2-cyclic phosphate phosphodiesterase